MWRGSVPKAQVALAGGWPGDLGESDSFACAGESPLLLAQFWLGLVPPLGWPSGDDEAAWWGACIVTLGCQRAFALRVFGRRTLQVRTCGVTPGWMPAFLHGASDGLPAGGAEAFRHAVRREVAAAEAEMRLLPEGGWNTAQLGALSGLPAAVAERVRSRRRRPTASEILKIRKLKCS